MRHGKVVVADAHQGMLAGVRTLLERVFSMVFMVADEVSLVEAVEKIRPDLVVADYSFQASDRTPVVEFLGANFPGLKVVVLSVYDEPVVVRSCLEAGALGFVLKGRAVNDLLPAIEAVLQGRRYVSPGIADDLIETFS